MTPAMTIWITLILALSSSIILAAKNNPHPKGSPHREGLRACRIGLCLNFWAYGFWLPGVLLGIVAAVLGGYGVFKGKRAYGAIVVAQTLVLQPLSLYAYFLTTQ